MASEKTGSKGSESKTDDAKSFSQKTSGTGKSGGDQSKSGGSHKRPSKGFIVTTTTTPKAKDSNLDLVELGAQMAMRKEELLAEMEE